MSCNTNVNIERAKRAGDIAQRSDTADNPSKREGGRGEGGRRKKSVVTPQVPRTQSGGFPQSLIPNPQSLPPSPFRPPPYLWLC